MYYTVRSIDGGKFGHGDSTEIGRVEAPSEYRIPPREGAYKSSRDKSVASPPVLLTLGETATGDKIGKVTLLGLLKEFGSWVLFISESWCTDHTP